MSYPSFEQSTDGLWCCKTGPPGCTCDIVEYELAADDGARVCLAANETSGSVVTTSCDSDSEDAANGGGWGMATWRETFYTADFQEVENWGPGYAQSHMCAGASDCSAGSAISLVDCEAGDDVKALLRWEGVGENGRLTSDSCPGMCLDMDDDSGDGAVVWSECDSAAQWVRVFLD